MYINFIHSLFQAELQGRFNVLLKEYQDLNRISSDNDQERQVQKRTIDAINEECTRLTDHNKVSFFFSINRREFNIENKLLQELCASISLLQKQLDHYQNSYIGGTSLADEFAAVQGDKQVKSELIIKDEDYDKMLAELKFTRQMLAATYERNKELELEVGFLL